MNLTTTTYLTFVYVLSIMYGWTVAIDGNDPISSQDGTFSDPREQSVGGKRAYNYRSEYKRLPLFQFGLGKRMAPDYQIKRTRGPLSFGLGKRKSHYVFGLGKRSGYEEDGYTNELYDNSALDSYSQDEPTESGFTFGLGKRNDETNDDNWLNKKRLMMKYAKANFPFGLGKRHYGMENDAELFA